MEPHVALAIGPPCAPYAPPALPPGHRMCRPSSCALTLYLVVTLGVVPALIIIAIETSRAYLLLFLGHVVLAVGALEWSWLAYRIRKKLLFTLREAWVDDGIEEEEGERLQVPVQHAEERDEDEQEQGHATRHLRRLREMRPREYAVSTLADRFCGGKWYVCAFAIAVCVAGGCLAVVYWIEHSVFDEEKNPMGWRMLTAVTLSGTFLSVFFSCLAPSKLDAFVVVVYQACFIASSMNTFLMYYANAIGVTDLLDPLFILLVGGCTIIVMRIITSKFVMESLLLVVCDILGLVVFAGPMVAFADFVDHPGAAKYHHKLALFFLVVFASEIGNWLAKLLKARFPCIFQWCHFGQTSTRNQNQHALKADVTPGRDIEAFFVATAFGCIMMLLSRIWGHNQSLSIDEAAVLVLAISLGQWSRVLLDNVKQTAEVSTTAFYLPAESSIGGALDRVAVFLVAVIVYHPYAKHVYYN